MRFSHLSTTTDRHPRLAAVIGDGALFLDEVMDGAPRDLQELIERGDEGLAHVRAVVDNAIANRTALEPVRDLRHASAVLRPPQVIAIGANYAAHASELKLRSEKAATVFSLWPNSLAGHEGTTAWPEDLTTQVDYEAELGVIIGKPARDVHVRDALDYVWGYTVVNDITARDLQFSEAQWSRCKSFDGFTPNGPSSSPPTRSPTRRTSGSRRTSTERSCRMRRPPTWCAASPRSSRSSPARRPCSRAR